MIDVCFFTDEVAEDFEESVRLGTEAGATAVEIRGNLFGKRVEELEKDDIKKIKEVLEKYNTEVAIIGSPVGKCSLFDSGEKAEHLEILKKMCDLAHELGTDLIRTFPFWVPYKFRDSDSRPELSSYLDEIIEGLDPMVEIAEKEKVKMCFETEGATFSGDCRELKQIIDNLNSPVVKVTWDILNGWNTSGELPYPDGYKLIEDKIEHLHVKPNKNNNIETVGDSTLSYEKIFKVLIDEGYDGAVSIEHWGSPELMLSGIRQLAKLLNKL